MAAVRVRIFWTCLKSRIVIHPLDSISRPYLSGSVSTAVVNLPACVVPPVGTLGLGDQRRRQWSRHNGPTTSLIVVINLLPHAGPLSPFVESNHHAAIFTGGRINTLCLTIVVVRSIHDRTSRHRRHHPKADHKTNNDSQKVVLVDGPSTLSTLSCSH